MAYYAFTDNNFQFTLENVQRFFTATSSVLQEDGSSAEVHTYLLIFWRSLKLAVISTVICLVLAYPLAYIMARAKPRTQKIFLTIIMIPMWMNFLIRTYAWMTILQDTGIFNNFLTLLHLPNVHIIGTEAAVVIGMVYDYIPYMILPLYSIMAKMDEKLIEAARDLGLTLREGVYFYCYGPQYETPAEIRAARILGGDAVGMSTAPEVVVAGHCGMEVLGITLLSNMAAGILDQPLSEREVLDAAEAAKEKFSGLIRACLRRM